MSEFEMASLEAQNLSLMLQALGLALSTLIGAGQIGIVWFGIRRMVDANEARTQAGERQARTQADLAQRQARSQADLAQRQERQAERRHTETMTALKALIERTG